MERLNKQIDELQKKEEAIEKKKAAQKAKLKM